MVFIAWEILNDTKQYGRFGYVHAKNKEKAGIHKNLSKYYLYYDKIAPQGGGKNYDKYKTCIGSKK